MQRNTPNPYGFRPKRQRVKKLRALFLGDSFWRMASAAIDLESREVAKKHRDRTKYVELSLNILREPRSPSNSGIRKWALTIFKEFSPKPLPEDAEADLQEGLAPAVSVGTVGTKITVAASPRFRRIRIRATAECYAEVNGKMKLIVLGPASPCEAGEVYRNADAPALLTSAVECLDELPANEQRVYEAQANNHLASGRTVRLEVWQ